MFSNETMEICASDQTRVYSTILAMLCEHAQGIEVSDSPRLDATLLGLGFARACKELSDCSIPLRYQGRNIDFRTDRETVQKIQDQIIDAATPVLQEIFKRGTLRTNMDAKSVNEVSEAAFKVVVGTLEARP